MRNSFFIYYYKYYYKCFLFYLTHTYLIFKFAHNIHVHTKCTILYIMFYLFCTLSNCILLFYYLLLVKFLVCVNIPGNKAHSDSDLFYFTILQMN